MSQALKINNFSSLNLVAQTRLDGDLAASQTNILVQNSSSFVAGDYFAIGTPGSETCEILVVSSIADATHITATDSTKFVHNKYDYVNKLFGNEVRIYRADNATGLQPADTEFSAIATVPMTLDSAETLYVDITGSPDYWYKYTYFNDTVGIPIPETNIADSKAARGGGTGDYCSIFDIREEAGFKYAKYITDNMIDRKRKAAQTEINGTLHGFYSVPFTAPINPFISDICVRLAAGLLLVEQYGQTKTTNNLNGQAKVDEARADLQKLVLKEVVLTDTTGQSQAEAGSTGAIGGWPTQNTANASPSDGGAPRVFRMSDIQGKQGTDSDGNPVGNMYYGRKW